MSRLSDGATFRMYARQIDLFRIEFDRDYIIDQIECLDCPEQFKELFKMCLDTGLVEDLGSALVNASA